MKTRLRLYTVFARARRADFSTDVADYAAGSHRVRYRVFAASLGHALYLARFERFAPDERLAGIRKIERAWWYDSVTPQLGDVVEAEYLNRTNEVLVPNHSKERSE